MSDPWRRPYEEGRRTWPQVRLAWGPFSERAVRAWPDAEPPAYARNLFLSYACLAGDPPALSSFDARTIAAARPSIARVHADPAFVDDVTQELRKKLLVGPPPGLTRYLGVSPLDGWVRISAVRLAYDVGRAGVFRDRERAEPDLEQIADEAIEPELLVLKRALGPSFQEALRAAIDALTPRDRNVLRMHLAQGLSIDQIAAPYGVHRATAARWLNDIRRKVLQDVRDRILARHATLDPSEIDSLARLVMSQLHVSLVRLEGPPSEPPPTSAIGKD